MNTVLMSDTSKAMIACPGAQHLAGTAGQVKQDRSRRRAHRPAQGRQFLAGERVMDAVTALANGEATRKINHLKQPLRCPVL
jgi:hypothetical protein